MRWRAPATAGVLLLVVYLASLAPGVTLWDAGELIAAIHTLGIPHPPGTPLFILIGKAWTLALSFVPTALALNALSAVCTAAAGALTATLVMRSTGRAEVAIAAALFAGIMSSAWLNATETEVYAVSLLLSMAIIVAADQAGRTGEERWVILSAYLIALAVPLHLTALVAVPTAMVLAAERVSNDESISGPSEANATWRQALKTWNWAWVLVLGGVAVLAVAASSASKTLFVVGATLLALSAQSLPRESRSRLAVVVPLILVALSALAFMLVRAPFDPGINQGDPSTLERWIAVITREQYAGAPHWPRQAPPWIQLANVLQYFDWQLALSLAPEPPLSAARGAVTLVGAALGVVGSMSHRRTDPRRWRAVAVLMLSGSIGVMGYLNLKPGPSIGWDILPDSTPHEPRERDYFFVLAFWAWAIWIAIGIANLLERLALRNGWAPSSEKARQVGGAVALIAAVAPIALNWQAVERRSEPGASLARVSAQAFLTSSPERAVLFVAGDNDSYPLWYLQHVEKFRTDVTVVTIPIIPADWYRAELARRHGLRSPVKWPGLSATMSALAADARRQGRPVVAAVSVDANERAALGTLTTLRGWVWTIDGGGDADGPSNVIPLARVLASSPGGFTSAEAAFLLAYAPGPLPPSRQRYMSPAQRYMVRLLSCPRYGEQSTRYKSAADSLDSTCNFR